jgi:hypothetical protein
MKIRYASRVKKCKHIKKCKNEAQSGGKTMPFIAREYAELVVPADHRRFRKVNIVRQF